MKIHLAATMNLDHISEKEISADYISFNKRAFCMVKHVGGDLMLTTGCMVIIKVY